VESHILLFCPIIYVGVQIWVYPSHLRTTSGQQVASTGLGEELWQGEMDN
jgi:hypothetical protein